MAKRLAAWALMEEKILALQKGFLPMEGCAKHSFIMEGVVTDTKKKKRDVRILWLDLRNTFQSVRRASL